MFGAAYAVVMQTLATCYYSCGNPDKAIDILEQCLMVLRQNLPSARNLLCMGECDHFYSYI
jgi:hypothetical protein